MRFLFFLWNAVWGNILAEIVWTLAIAVPGGWAYHHFHFKKMNEILRQHHENMTTHISNEINKSR